MMPDMNGVEFLRELRHRPVHRETPVVIATSQRDTSPLLIEARLLGVPAIVKKPWKRQELAEIVRRVSTASTGASDTLPRRRELLSDADVRILTLAENGHTYRPTDAADGVFDLLVDHLRKLRDQGLLRLEEGRIMKSQRGGY